MTHLPHIFTAWLTSYGSIAIFFLLAFGIFALPIPDETLMVFSGVLMAKGKLPVTPTVLAAMAGAICGITLSYLLGRTAGYYIIRRWGHWVRITEAKLNRIHNWFESIGKWSLLIGYFIPGVRHLTGYAAGISKLHYRYFALFAYMGAIVWVSIFLSAGYFLGNRTAVIHEFIQDEWYLLVVLIVAIAIIFCSRIFFKRHRYFKHHH